MKDTIEDLFDKYVLAPRKESFEELIRTCHKALLSFLLSKRMQCDDAEDLLQEFFIKEFDRSIKSYEKGQNGWFFYYLQRIVFFRYLSFYKKMRRDNERFESIATGRRDLLSSTNTEVNVIRSFIKAEVMEFFAGIIKSIENENHRDAFILKLCCPLELSSLEAASIMGCTQSTYSTWLFRATCYIKEKIQAARKSSEIKFNFNDVMDLLSQETLSFDKEFIYNIEDDIVREVLSLYFFSNASIETIGIKLALAEGKVSALFKRGMFELLSLLSKKEILLRRGNLLMLYEDDVIEFIESLDKNNDGFLRRSSLSTGDKNLDLGLRLIHRVYKSQLNTSSSMKVRFLDAIAKQDISLSEAGKKLDLNRKDINAIMKDDESKLDEVVKIKVESFIDNFGENRTNMQETKPNFDKISGDFLKSYYKAKQNM